MDAYKILLIDLKDLSYKIIKVNKTFVKIVA